MPQKRLDAALKGSLIQLYFEIRNHTFNLQNFELTSTKP